MRVELEQPQTIAAVRAPALALSARWLPAALLALAGLLNLVTLLRAPVPFVDEGSNAARAWGLVQTGRAFGSLDAGAMENFAGYWTYFPWLGTFLHALPLYLFSPQLFAVRLVSLLFGLLLLLAVYTIGNKLAGPRVGALGVLLLSLSATYIYASHLARHDIIVAALGWSAVALFLIDKSKGLSPLSLLSGLLVGLSLDVHLNGVVFGLFLGLLYLLDYRLAVLRNWRFWSFAAGSALGVAFFVVMHVLPYPESYFAIGSLGNGASRTPPLASLDVGVILTSLLALAAQMVLTWAVPVILAAVPLLLLRKRTAGDNKLLILLGLLMVIVAASIRSLQWYYAILLTPAAALVLAAFIDKLLSGDFKTARDKLLRLALPGLAALSCLLNLAPLLNNANDEFEAALAQVRQTIPANAAVLGAATYWFALPDARYLSWDQINYYRRYAPAATLAETFQALGTEYLVLDTYNDKWLTDDPAKLADADGGPYLAKSEFDAFLAAYGELKSTLSTPSLGELRIYQLHLLSSQ